MAIYQDFICESDVMYIIFGHKFLLSHISFKPIVLSMISDVIAAYTHCGDVQPKPPSNATFQEEN